MPLRWLSRACALLVVSLALCGGVPAEAATTQTFAPTADTYVRSDAPATGSGGAAQVEVDGSPQQQTLLRFDVAGLGGRPVLGAKLRLWVTNSSASGGEVHRLMAPFDELAATWSVRPAFDPGVVGRLPRATAGQWSEVDVSSAVPGAGPVLLGALSTNSDGAWYASREAGAATAPQLVLTLGDSSDTQPPTAPANLAATAAAANQVDLSWQASSDAVGVTGYRVYRDGVQVAAPTGTSYSDTGAQPQSTYVYTVVAVDDAGNVSPPSNEASVTTPAAATPSTVVLTPAADTGVRSDTPSTSYGTATQLLVDGSPQQQLLLRFDVGDLGGRPVLDAKLRLWVTNPSATGGEVHRLAAPFDEQTASWSSKPDLDPTVLGKFGRVTAGQWAEADLGSAVSGTGPVELGALSTNSDGAWYASREAGAAQAPQLVLTLGDAPPPPPPPPPPADKLQVGAYYYPWYGTARRHWSSGYLRGALDVPQQPLLGEYDSLDAQTVATHFQWAQQYGIDTFIASWGGPGSYTDTAIRDHLLASPAIGPTKVAAFYESTGNLPKTNGVIDLDSAATEQKLIDDVDYMARTLFANPGYARVGDRPVVYFYVTRTWHGDVAKAIADLRTTIESRYGYDLYLVGDEVGFRSSDKPVADHIRLFDAITSYSLYAATEPPGWPDDTGLLAQVRQRYDAYKAVADQYGVAFIPDAQPGFNDRAVRLASNHYVLPREVNATTPPGTDSLFAQALELDAGYLDATRPALNVTTFNEWHEDTQVEPTAPGPESSGPTAYTLGYDYPSDGFRPLELLQAFRAAHAG